MATLHFMIVSRLDFVLFEAELGTLAKASAFLNCVNLLTRRASPEGRPRVVSVCSARGAGRSGGAAVGQREYVPEGAPRSAVPRAADAPRQVVDKYNDLQISCFCTATQTRFLLLHDARLGEEPVRAFFNDVYDLYLKACHAARRLARLLTQAQASMNPFHSPQTRIESARFDVLVRASARRQLFA